MTTTNTITTIKLNKETKARLDKLKVHKKESYDEVLQEVLGILNTCKADPYKALSKLRSIDVLRERLSKKDKTKEAQKIVKPKPRPQPMQKSQVKRQ